MIEAEFLEELERFNLALKKNSVEVREGEQKSQSSGQGMIFEDHKRYNPGDDIRRMDWKAYARTGEFFIKRFEEEKSLTVHILVDRSSSMDFGEVNKYEYAARLGLAGAFMVSNTNDRFRFSVFSETVTDISSGRREASLASLVDTLNGLRKTPESKVETCLSEYASRIDNKSVVVVISDFLVDVEEVENGLSALKGTDVILVNLLAEEELNPSIQGDAKLKDPESGTTLRTFLSNRIRSNYKSDLQRHVDAVEEAAHKHGAYHLQVSTSDDFFDSFMSMWRLMNRE